MTDLVSLSIPINPVPAGRPRVVNRGGRSMTFTPEKTRDFYEAVRQYLGFVYRGKPLEGDLSVTLRFWRHIEGREQRGDLSNAIKAVEDSCEGFLFVNDRQIVQTQARFVEWGRTTVGRFEVEVRAMSDVAVSHW